MTGKLGKEEDGSVKLVKKSVEMEESVKLIKKSVKLGTGAALEGDRKNQDGKTLK